MVVRGHRGRSGSASAALVLAIVLVGGARAAHADPIASSPPVPVPEAGVDAPDAAIAAKRRGDDALVNGRHAEALAAYQEAVALRPDPALIYNIGRAHQGLGDYPAALDALETFERTAPPDVRARVPGLPMLLADVRKHVALVFVSSDVAGATVRLGPRVLGTTPLPAPVRVNVGTYTLFVEKDGYFPVERAATVGGGGGIVTFDGRLVSKTTQGIVTVRSSLAGAKVACDGKAEGTVPTEVVVAPGTHQFELTLDGYRPARTSVVVAAGERRSIDLGLEAEAPITKKWWFWTGLGVLAAGATVVVIALSTERSPDTGTAGTGRINAGLRF
jgi:hypothetical protein